MPSIPSAASVVAELDSNEAAVFFAFRRARSASFRALRFCDDDGVERLIDRGFLGLLGGPLLVDGRFG